VEELPRTPMTRPVRVVLFCGPILERGMIRFAHLLDQHEEVEFAGAFCQTKGLGTVARLRDLWKRRKLVALPLLALQIASAAGRWLTQPSFERALGARRRWLIGRMHQTTDLHAPEVLVRVAALQPDLGLIYGGPILRPELFTIPRLGTFGIHHGTLPTYRGKKTTFWAMDRGEARAGVTIQRVNAGVDTGELVRYGDVLARSRSYRRVEYELEELGLDLYLDAVAGVRRGTTRTRPIEGEKGKVLRDPRPADLLRFARRRLRERLRGERPAGAARGALLLTESYHPMVGGGETQARTLAASLTEAGLPVTVVTRCWDLLQPRIGRVDACTVERIGPAGRGHLKKWGLALTAFGPIRAHRRHDRVLLVNGYRVLGIPATLAARLHGSRVILKADSPGELSGAFFDAGLRRFGLSHRSLPARIVLGARNCLLRRADAFVAISSAVASELERYGIERARIHRIPNGVDPQVFRPAREGEREEMRRAHGLPESARIAMYTGRLVRYKGLPSLLRVWERIAASHPAAHLVLVGGGSEDIHNCEAELHSFVNERGLKARITFTGPIESVADVLRAADLFVFPTEEEAFGLSALEAMASGLAVVSTRTGGLADFVCEENGAVVVEAADDQSLHDGIVRVLDDADFAAELGTRGRRVAVEHYSLASVRDRYLELIDRLGGR
jgi:glycosyltransferase involved in cell wall biosynthesis